MPRKNRIWYPGAIYHVMSRGNRRSEIFLKDNDYELFLMYLKMIRDKLGFKIHSICLMTNHFHILIETETVELSKIMQKLLSMYAEEFNYLHGFTGHLFEGRYTAKLIEDERYFLEVSRYIHLNPVKANMVREPLDYDYSSYGMFVEGKAGLQGIISEIVTTDRILEYFDQGDWKEYRMFVEGKNSHEEQEMLIQKDMKEDDMWLP